MEEEKQKETQNEVQVEAIDQKEPKGSDTSREKNSPGIRITNADQHVRTFHPDDKYATSEEDNLIEGAKGERVVINKHLSPVDTLRTAIGHKDMFLADYMKSIVRSATDDETRITAIQAELLKRWHSSIGSYYSYLQKRLATTERGAGLNKIVGPSTHTGYISADRNLLNNILDAAFNGAKSKHIATTKILSQAILAFEAISNTINKNKGYDAKTDNFKLTQATQLGRDIIDVIESYTSGTATLISTKDERDREVITLKSFDVIKKLAAEVESAIQKKDEEQGSSDYSSFLSGCQALLVGLERASIMYDNETVYHTSMRSEVEGYRQQIEQLDFMEEKFAPRLKNYVKSLHHSDMAFLGHGGMVLNERGKQTLDTIGYKIPVLRRAQLLPEGLVERTIGYLMLMKFSSIASYLQIFNWQQGRKGNEEIGVDSILSDKSRKGVYTTIEIKGNESSSNSKLNINENLDYREMLEKSKTSYVVIKGVNGKKLVEKGNATPYFYSISFSYRKSSLSFALQDTLAKEGLAAKGDPSQWIFSFPAVLITKDLDDQGKPGNAELDYLYDPIVSTFLQYNYIVSSFTDDLFGLGAKGISGQALYLESDGSSVKSGSRESSRKSFLGKPDLNKDSANVMRAFDNAYEILANIITTLSTPADTVVKDIHTSYSKLRSAFRSLLINLQTVTDQTTAATLVRAFIETPEWMNSYAGQLYALKDITFTPNDYDMLDDAICASPESLMMSYNKFYSPVTGKVLTNRSMKYEQIKKIMGVNDLELSPQDDTYGENQVLTTNIATSGHLSLCMNNITALAESYRGVNRSIQLRAKLGTSEFKNYLALRLEKDKIGAVTGRYRDLYENSATLLPHYTLPVVVRDQVRSEINKIDSILCHMYGVIKESLLATVYEDVVKAISPLKQISIMIESYQKNIWNVSDGETLDIFETVRPAIKELLESIDVNCETVFNIIDQTTVKSRDLAKERGIDPDSCIWMPSFSSGIEIDDLKDIDYNIRAAGSYIAMKNLVKGFKESASILRYHTKHERYPVERFDSIIDMFVNEKTMDLRIEPESLTQKANTIMMSDISRLWLSEISNEKGAANQGKHTPIGYIASSGYNLTYEKGTLLPKVKFDIDETPLFAYHSYPLELFSGNSGMISSVEEVISKLAKAHRELMVHGDSYYIDRLPAYMLRDTYFVPYIAKYGLSPVHLSTGRVSSEFKRLEALTLTSLKSKVLSLFGFEHDTVYPLNLTKPFLNAVRLIGLIAEVSPLINLNKEGEDLLEGRSDTAQSIGNYLDIAVYHHDGIRYFIDFWEYDLAFLADLNQLCIFEKYPRSFNSVVIVDDEDGYLGPDRFRSNESYTTRTMVLDHNKGFRGAITKAMATQVDRDLMLQIANHIGLDVTAISELVAKR